MALQERRGGVHRAEAHLRRIEPGPLRVDDAADRRRACALRPRAAEASTTHAPPSVTCELLPAVTLPYLRSKNGLSFARFSTRRVLAHAVVRRVERARRRRRAASTSPAKWPAVLRGEHARVAARRVRVHLRARDAEAIREVLRGLAHQQAARSDR